ALPPGAWTIWEDGGIEDGAVGENRTHDLSLTKGLRYHYATTATVVPRPLYRTEPLTRNCRPVRPPDRFRVRCYNVRIPRRKAGYSDFHGLASPSDFKGF